MADHYATLGVSPASDDVVIQAAFRALMLKYHPDTNTSPDATRRASEINAAYAVLGDPARRAAYHAARSTPRLLPAIATAPAPATHVAQLKRHRTLPMSSLRPARAPKPIEPPKKSIWPALTFFLVSLGIVLFALLSGYRVPFTGFGPVTDTTMSSMTVDGGGDLPPPLPAKAQPQMTAPPHPLTRTSEARSALDSISGATSGPGDPDADQSQ